MYYRAVKCQRAANTDINSFLATLDAGSMYYVVNIAQGTCSCPDATLQKTVCKHMFAITEKPQYGLSFNDLPEALRNHPRLVIDMGFCQTAASQLAMDNGEEVGMQAEIQDIIDQTGLDPTDEIDLNIDRTWVPPPKSRVAAARRRNLDAVHLIRTNVYGASEEALLSIEQDLQKVLDKLKNMCPVGSGWLADASTEITQPTVRASQILSAPPNTTQSLPSCIAPVPPTVATMVDITNEFPAASQPGRKRNPNKRAFPLVV